MVIFEDSVNAVADIVSFGRPHFSSTFACAVGSVTWVVILLIAAVKVADGSNAVRATLFLVPGPADGGGPGGGGTGGIIGGGGGSSELGGPGGSGRIGLLGRLTSGPTMSDARSSFNPTFRLQVS